MGFTQNVPHFYIWAGESLKAVTCLTIMTKKEKDRIELQKFVDRFSQRESEWLINHLSIGLGNKLARQAINIILKERGVKVKKMG